MNNDYVVCYVVANERMYDQMVINAQKGDLYLWKIYTNRHSYEKYNQLNDLYPVAIKKIDIKEAKRLLNKKEHYNKRVLLDTTQEAFEDDYMYENGDIYPEYNYDLYIQKMRDELY